VLERIAAKIAHFHVQAATSSEISGAGIFKPSGAPEENFADGEICRSGSNPDLYREIIEPLPGTPSSSLSKADRHGFAIATETPPAYLLKRNYHIRRIEFVRRFRIRTWRRTSPFCSWT
jgi:hypothetical protein